MAKKKDTNGTNGAGRFDEAIAASAAKDRPRAVQTRLDLGTDVCTVYEHHDVQVPVSDDEAALLNARAAEETARALAEEAEIQRLKKELLAPREAAAKEARKNADQAAREAGERKRTVNMQLRVEYHPSTATVRFLHPDTGKAVMLERAMTPRELENYSQAADPPSDERVDIAGTEAPDA